MTIKGAALLLIPAAGWTALLDAMHDPVTFRRLHDHFGGGRRISHKCRVCPAAATESGTGERKKAVTIRIWSLKAHSPATLFRSNRKRGARPPQQRAVRHAESRWRVSSDISAGARFAN